MCYCFATALLLLLILSSSAPYGARRYNHHHHRHHHHHHHYYYYYYCYCASFGISAAPPAHRPPPPPPPPPFLGNELALEGGGSECTGRGIRLREPVFFVGGIQTGFRTPNPPTKIIHAKIRRLETSGKFPMDMRVPPLEIKILLESNLLKSRSLVRRLAVKGNFCNLCVFPGQSQDMRFR